MNKILEFLDSQRLNYEVKSFETEKDLIKYKGWNDAYLNIDNIDNPAYLITILNPYHSRNIEIIVTKNKNEFIFEYLGFGDYSFEIEVNYNDIEREKVILETIINIINKKIYIINSVVNKTGYWLWDACFDNESDFENKKYKIENKAKIFSFRKIKYEFYSWNSYKSIIK